MVLIQVTLSPAYVKEVLACFREAYAEAQHQSNSKAD